MVEYKENKALVVDFEGASKHYKKVTIFGDENNNVNVYVVTDKKNKVEVMTADLSKKDSKAPEQIKRVIDEIKSKTNVAELPKPRLMFWSIFYWW
jgi:hypothetical protein